MEREQYIREQLSKDYELLKKLEDRQRYEDDPRRRGKLEADIEEINQQISQREAELKSLKSEGSNSEKVNSDLLTSPSQSEGAKLKGRRKPNIGIITALPKEYAAVKQVLEHCEEISVPGQGAGRRYMQGEIPARFGGEHCVVLCLADMGNNQASSRATLLLEHFPDIDSIIMVGIAGGIPYPEKSDEHVRLGDLVISNQKGVIQYDFVKETFQENIDRHLPRPPSAALLEGVRLLEAEELEGKRPWLQFIESALLPPGEKRPSDQTDILVSSTNPEEKIEHPADRKRKKGEPRVFIDPIASANTLLKNPIKRDQLRDKFGVKAVEMESSGIADATWNHDKGYLVVRGICDYCDINKNDLWQPYAAAVAAAYTRALLESMPSPKKKLEGQKMERMELIKTLNRITLQQLNTLILMLNPPKEVMPAPSAPQGDLVYALLNWAEAPGGCGLEKVQQVFEEDFKEPLR